MNNTKFECADCFYCYDPAIGDAEFDLPAGVPFADLPADWVCPLCGAGKDKFHPVEE